MSDPYGAQEPPRNVTPGQDWRERTRRDGGWSGMEWGDRRGFPWLGVFLVLAGLGLVLRQIEPRLDIGSLILGALGLAMLAAWAFNRGRGPLLPGLVLVALGAVQMLRDVGVVVGSGWTPLFIGAALIVAWLVGRVQGSRSTWPLFVGGLLVLYGLTQVSGRLLDLPELSLIWPVLIVLAGIALILGSMRGSGTRTP